MNGRGLGRLGAIAIPIISTLSLSTAPLPAQTTSSTTLDTCIAAMDVSKAAYAAAGQNRPPSDMCKGMMRPASSAGDLDKQIATCRQFTSTQLDGYPENLSGEIAKDAELGTFVQLTSICQAYLAGKRDTLTESVKVLSPIKP